MSRFRYSDLVPLDIRLVELQPGSPEDPLEGTILHRHFSPAEKDIPGFEALSYAWGDQSNPDSIKLSREQHPHDEQPFQVSETGSVDIGQNLASALRALRHHNEPRILWCDSICINQQDIEERAAQVRRMNEIFQHAKSVIVWMGPETSWSVLLMETLRWVGYYVEKAVMDPVSQRHRFIFANVPDQYLQDNTKPLPLRLDQWRAMEQFLALDWIKRLWTCQEIYLANQETCVVRLGGEEMLWAKLKDIVVFVCFYALTPSELLLDQSSYTSNAHMFAAKTVMCEMPLWDEWPTALRMTNDFLCSDVRDRVFAVHGLVTPELAQAIRPDYTKTTKHIFTSVCLDHITRQNDLKFLGLCNAATSPSWVADLEKPISRIAVDNHATGNSPPTAIVDDPGVLEVAGIACDELCCDAVSLPNNKLTQPDAEYRQMVVDLINTLAKSNLLQEDEYLDNLIMMLTFGGVRDYFIKEHQWSASLKDWRKTLRRWVGGILDDENRSKDFASIDRMHIRLMQSGNTSTGCSRTQRGSFIRVPHESRSGDIVVAVLGSDNPIVLRPQNIPGSYLVIGPCYHPEFAHAEAVLGNDFHGWAWRWDRVKHVMAFSKDGEPLRRTDPRLDQVPLSDGVAEWLIDVGIPCWGHPGRGDVSLFDPRMSEAELKKRGVPIQRFRLV
ncbi:hypothetical protein FSARC_3039 [Fusarium sarcochroum]|uniref:Heterokaryon incompatibility domain-containing protein n=1 Tax=Fusarium sarcochroum TaxID=1208366 RepID=A0A8H4XD55_9HYPO|nr:hypothetical protein FSARC_3039 [Fusarium sarcochroum]